MSDNIIDLAKVRDAKEEPDADLVGHDGFGRKLYTFSYQFRHSDGKDYGFDFLAYDFEDAEAKLASIRASAVLVGKLYSRIPE